MLISELWIRIGSGFNDFVDPDSESGSMGKKKVPLWIRISIRSGFKNFVDPD
jgi:hypothetical protein